jgi:hypothetical protein
MAVKIGLSKRKNPNITESVRMSTQSVVDQEMKDLERKEIRNPATPTGKRVRVCNIGANIVKTLLHIIYRSSKIRIMSVQSSNWHKEYRE